MKKYFLLLLIFTKIGNAQNLNLADSLVKDLAKQKTDTGKLKTLSELSFYYATNNPALSLKYANEQKQIAEKIEKAMKADEAVRREIYRIATTISGSGKLTDYGTVKAQEYLKKWAKEKKDSSDSTPTPDQDPKK